MSFEVVLIISEEETKLERFGFGFTVDKDGKLYFTSEKKFLNIFRNDSVIQFYETEEIETIKKYISKPIFYVVDTNAFDLLINFLQKIPKQIKVLIDNDHGSIKELESILTFTNMSQLLA